MRCINCGQKRHFWKFFNFKLSGYIRRVHKQFVPWPMCKDCLTAVIKTLDREAVKPQ